MRQLKFAVTLAAMALSLAAFSVESIDILVCFDASARDWAQANGKGSLDSYARSCVARCNEVLPATDLNRYFQFRLAGTVVVNEDVSSMGLDAILTQKLVSNNGTFVGKGEWAKVAKARDDVGADIVTVLVAKGSEGNVGLGYTLRGMEPSRFAPFAYNVCSIDAVDTRYTMVHEIGHNMGCGHPDDNDSFDPSYSHGLYFETGGTRYYTVMGYNLHNGVRYEPCPAFSSARHTFNGAPLGDASHDNTRTLIATYQAVAAFRAASNDGDNTVVSGLSYAPQSATTVALPIYDGLGSLAGVVQLKYGKMNAKKQTSKVSGTVQTLDGKRYSIKAATVECGGNPIFSSTAKNVGDVSLTLFGDGFSGRVGDFTVAAGQVGGEYAKTVAVSLDAGFPATINGGAVATQFLPQGEPVTLAGKKWICNKAASVKYAKDKETGLYGWVVNGGKADAVKTNLSGLKLNYTLKTGAFKGSFTVYTLLADKLKKVKFNVTGFLVDGIVRGRASAKKVGDYGLSAR